MRKYAKAYMIEDRRIGNEEENNRVYLYNIELGG
jgi:hypothetical protein